MPPHRAAIPVTHGLSQSRAIREAGSARWVQFALSAGLHGAFFAAAILWGQGGRLPDRPDDAAVSIEIVSADTLRFAQKSDPLPAPGNRPPAAPDDAGAELAELSVGSPAAQEALPADASNGGHYGSLAAAIAEPGQDDFEQPATQSAAPNAEPSAPPQPGQEPLAPSNTDGGPIPITVLPQASSAASAEESAQPKRARGRQSASRARARRALSPAAAAYRRAVRWQIAQNLPEGGLGAGRVTVGLRLSADGGVLRSSVLRSSGNPAIDRAALASVRMAAPYPAAPRGLKSSHLFLKIPFAFE